MRHKFSFKQVETETSRNIASDDDCSNTQTILRNASVITKHFYRQEGEDEQQSGRVHEGVRRDGRQARVLVRGVQEVPGLVAAEHGQGQRRRG